MSADRRDASRRARLAAAYEGCGERDRLVLALLLLERLTLAETADALGLTVLEVRRAYRQALDEVGRRARAARIVPARTRRPAAVERLRRAS